MIINHHYLLGIININSLSFNFFFFPYLLSVSCSILTERK